MWVNILKQLTLEMCVFVLFTFLISSIFTYLWVTSEDSAWLLGFAWGPGIAGIITAFLFRKKISGFGWSLGNVRYLLMSYFTPILYCLLIYGVVWLSPFGSYGGFESAYITSFPTMTMLGFLLQGTLYAAHSAIGEEIGWRGYLTPTLLQYCSPFQTSLMVGILWSLWHYPIIVLGLYGTDVDLVYQLICFSLMTIGVNFIYTWFRVKSGSLWTGLLLHSSHNLYIQHVFNPMTLNTGKTDYVIGEFRAALAIFGLFTVILVLLNKRTFNDNLSKSIVL
ncbi:CPBP family intramembrane glutamic endopeptidase [Pseudoalteromonas xiamenensis]|uniref:CPBP family intramembrane glutamic endopeptidase n=1 Tax=Pseudoalteromonas xiamenensis TaxID=882626 RepID=UPI0035ECAB19